MNKNVFRDLSYGLYIITSIDGDRPVGYTGNTVVQITSDPATVAISCNKENYTSECIKKSGKFAVSILSENNDATLIGQFGFQSSRDSDKFSGIAARDVDGLKVIESTCSYITCKLIQTVETSTHNVYIGEVTGGETLASGTPMTYAYYHNVLKGNSPKAAPTYIAEDESKKDDLAEKKWVCQVCKYVYDGDIPFEELSEDFTCPVCGMPKSKFALE